MCNKISYTCFFRQGAHCSQTINYVSLCFKKSVTMSLFTQIALEIIFINNY